MAIAFTFEVDGVGADQYDGLMEAMGLGSADAAFPAGLIAHLAGPQGDGWRVTDVWESADAANAFYGSDQFAPVRDDPATAGINPMVWALHRVQIGS